MAIPGVQFLQEAFIELKKSTWLSRKEVTGSTIVVIVLVSLMAVYVASVDFLLNIFLTAFLGRGT